jgi:hypothetical protein
MPLISPVCPMGVRQIAFQFPKMVKLFGPGRRLTRQSIPRMYEKGQFQTEKRKVP